MTVEHENKKPIGSEAQPSVIKPPPLFTFSSPAEPRQKQIVAVLSLVTGLIWIFSVPAVLGQIARSENALYTRIVSFKGGDLFVSLFIGLPGVYSDEPFILLTLLAEGLFIALIENLILLVVAMGYPFVFGIFMGSWYESKGSGFMSYGIDLWFRISIPIGFMVSIVVFGNDFISGDEFTNNFINGHSRISFETFLSEQLLPILLVAFFMFIWIFVSVLFVLLFIFVPTSMGYRVGLWVTQAVGEES